MTTRPTIAIPKSVFRRVVKDEIGPGKLVTQEALTLLQNETEKFMETQFNWAAEVAGAHGRVTLTPHPAPQPCRPPSRRSGRSGRRR